MQKARVLFIFYLFGIILLVTLPLTGLNHQLSHNFILEIRLDYLSHIFLFLPFAFLFSRAYSLKLLLILLIGLLFAIGSEGLQFFLPYRTFNINDLLSNALGILTGVVLFIPPIHTFLNRGL